ncbi:MULTISPECIES: MerR family transcriptional regulator [Acinetobacter]|jgi:DNA-binding transcriptional MerR regulator|uniref:MerR family transcriptional regulator n=2 Tax=Acinetobacter TaxID=469 RepID=A0A4V2DPH9_9GAMM|nr:MULTISPECIES: MerR family transcriptional regulator [Acinetobacter]MCW8040856.1 MerR family transcriptional regulator [Acinetobacter entericus]RZG66808.1 MerR family transcriptional regulator [Acinetobacter bouvetii]TCB76202.1 MerR family transcriptional regulator [Acinetobacter sp. ANC 4177]
MLIGELSQQMNMSRDTIRFYEKMQLIHPLIRNNGYKDYPEQTLQQLQLIQVAKNLGFTLAEIRQIIHLVNESEIPAEQFQEILQDKLNTVREKIGQLQQMQTMLENLMKREPCPFKKGCDVIYDSL